MRTLFAAFVISILIALSQPDGRAGEPTKKSEWIPLPQIVSPPQVFIVPDLPRLGSRDMWRYYGVDSFGRWVPRIILTPDGAYNLRTLEPYPASNRTTAVLPSVLGAPGGAIVRPEVPFILPAPTSMPFAPPVPAPFMPYAVD